MKEQLITFETAKLAKEKGFDENCYSYYKNEELKLGPFCKTITSNLYGKRTEIFKYTNSEKDNHITAPTQSLLQKWLREEHQIYVEAHIAIYTSQTFAWHLAYRFGAEVRTNGCTEYIYTTYEEALEIGLQEALKLI